MGSVYRQAGRRNYTIKYWVDGKPVVESTGLDDEQKAQDLLSDRETDVRRGVPLATGIGKIRFDKAAESLLTDYRLNNYSNIQGVRTIITKHLQPVFGGRRMATISALDARDYADHKITDGYQPATVNNHLSALIRMFTICREHGVLLQQPVITKLAVDNARQGFFEREEFEALYAVLPQWMRDPVEFAYYTGWRVQSEVLPLEWGRHVDERGGIVRLSASETKGNKGRVFPYDVLPELAQLIARLRRESKERQQRTSVITPWLFHDDGRPLTLECGWASHAFRDAWKAGVTAAGIPDRIPHDLRRTAVRNLVRAGVPEKTAMQLTGHKTRCVFDRYDIVNEADLRNGVTRLAEATNPAEEPPARGKVVGLKKRGKN